MTRSVIYILVPLSLVLAVALVSQGVIQTVNGSANVSILQPVHGVNVQPLTDQTLALGPAASQVAIKQLGTNGGGFFNVNSAHPFENPTPLSNFLEMLAILLIPAALCYTFGKMVGDTRKGWAILAAMTIVFVVILTIVVMAEQGGNPSISAMGIDQTASDTQAGGNMEGKEVRFGIASSALWATATTAALMIRKQHARFIHPSGRLIPDVVDAARGSSLRGCGFGVVRYADLRYHSCVHSRTNDRAHTRVSRQEG